MNQLELEGNTRGRSHESIGTRRKHTWLEPWINWNSKETRVAGAMNQLELEGNTRGWSQSGGTTWEQVIACICFVSYWWGKWRIFNNQSQSLTTQNKPNANYFLLDGLWKTTQSKHKIDKQTSKAYKDRKQNDLFHLVSHSTNLDLGLAGISFHLADLRPRQGDQSCLSLLSWRLPWSKTRRWSDWLVMTPAWRHCENKGTRCYRSRK